MEKSVKFNFHKSLLLTRSGVIRASRYMVIGWASRGKDVAPAGLYLQCITLPLSHIQLETLCSHLKHWATSTLSAQGRSLCHIESRGGTQIEDISVIVDVQLY